MEHQHCPSCGGTGRLRRSDPLHGETEREWLPETPGLKFMPTEQQLMVHYLIPYALRRPIPAGNHVVKEQVYEKAPWDLLGPHRDKYFFTTRTMHGKRWKRTVGDGMGTWSGTTGKGKDFIKSADGEELGLKSKLSYCVVKKKSTGYTMDEYEVSPDFINNNNYTEQERARLQEWVLCCVKKSLREDSKGRQDDVARSAVAASVVGSEEQTHHEGAFEISGEYHDCKRRAVAVTENAAAAGSVPWNGKSSVAFGITAANCSARPFSKYDADCSATRPMHLFTAAEASLEGRAQTKAINSASANQMAVDQQLPPCSASDLPEEIVNNDIFYPREASELDTTNVEVAATAEHHSLPLSSRDGDQPTASAISTGEPDWQKLSNLGFDWETSLDWETSRHTDSPLLYSDDLWSGYSLKSLSELALAGVVASAAADCSATPPMYLPTAAEASLEGRVNTDTIKHASTNQIMLSSAVNLQPPAYNDSHRMEEKINADNSDTCEGYEI